MTINPQKYKNKRKFQLDNSSLYHMASNSSEWSNIFRLSATLKKDVDPKALQNALDKTSNRFPTITAGIYPGLTNYYQKAYQQSINIFKENRNILKPISKKDLRHSPIRVLYSNKTISVEIFHAVTDGNGAFKFFNSLLAEYLEQLYSIKIPATSGIFDRNASPSQKEINDSYLDIPFHNSETPKMAKAYQVSDEKNENLYITTYIINLSDMKKITHKLDVSITVLITSLFTQALSKIRDKDNRKNNNLPINIFIPVDLRNYFPSSTLKNFVSYVNIVQKPLKHKLSLENTVQAVKQQLSDQLTKNNVASKVSFNVKTENSMVIKKVPLFLKNLIMKPVFKYSERTSTMTVSNLGIIKLSEEMKKYIERYDIILSPRKNAPYNCGIVSFGNNIHINITRNSKSDELESEFSTLLQEMNLPCKTEVNSYRK